MPTGKCSPANSHRPPNPRPEQFSPRAQRNGHPHDRLGHAGGLVGAAVVMVTLVMVILTADTIKGLYPREDQATLFYHAIGLNELALTPSGRQARRPAPLPTAVDWRYDPALPKQPPGLIPLLDQRMLTTPKVVAP